MTTAAQQTPGGAKAGSLMVYIGGYNHDQKKGLYLYRMDLTSGHVLPAGDGPDVDNPSFLAIHPNHRFLYAVNEISNYAGTKDGSVSAYAIDPATGSLTSLNVQPSGGSGPCHLSVDKWGKNVLVANYGSGSVAVLPIHHDGRLGAPSSMIQHHGTSANPQRQEGPHAHSINLDPANHYALAADLGLDKILTYRFDAQKGVLSPGKPEASITAAGSGPRHFAFHPNGRIAYVISELNSTISALAYNADTGALKTLQTLSTLPEGFTGNNSTAEVQVSPDGRFVYGSNRGEDSIAIFRIDPHTGLLTPAGRQSTQGKTPRNFCIDPTGQYLVAANQDTNNVVVFRIDRKSGSLTPTGQVIEVPAPACVVMMQVR